jgi:hypothetical protein
MRIHTRLEYEWNDAGELALVHEEGYEYSGPLALCGGGGSSDPEQDALEAEEASFDTTLQGIFSSQYATQAAQLQFLQGQLEPEIKNPTGYTPTQLATQRTEATDVNSEQYQAAQQALNNEVSQNSGGSKLTGVAGANEETDAQLLNAEAQAQAGSQETITQNNANLEQSNYWNAINALNGVAAQENPLGYATASTQASEASSAASNASTNRIQATASPLFGALGGAFGGLGTAAAGIWCKVAMALYGEHATKTWMVRFWMMTEAPKWFSSWYRKHSGWIAKTPLRYAFLPLFEFVLARA